MYSKPLLKACKGPLPLRLLRPLLSYGLSVSFSIFFSIFLHILLTQEPAQTSQWHPPVHLVALDIKEHITCGWCAWKQNRFEGLCLYLTRETQTYQLINPRKVPRTTILPLILWFSRASSDCCSWFRLTKVKAGFRASSAQYIKSRPAKYVCIHIYSKQYIYIYI